MNPWKHDTVCSFVEKAIRDKQYNHELHFALSDITVRRVKQILYLNLESYIGVISSHSVRHIKHRHPDDVMYICHLMEILEKFSRVQKSITRDSKTGASLVSLEFYKRYEQQTVKLVELKVHREKRLELKTLFVKD